MRRALLLSLAGSAVLAAFSIAALPFSRGLFRAPRTPFDASEADFMVPPWVLLQRANALVPRGATVVVRAEPPNPTTDSYLHRIGVALLPGRRIIPAALWGVSSSPDQLVDADYEIVVGPVASSPGRRLVLSTREGSVWRRGQ